MKFKLYVLAIGITASSLSFAKTTDNTTKFILSSSEVDDDVKAAVKELMTKKSALGDTLLEEGSLWTKDAIMQIKALKTATPEQLRKIREDAELDIEEVKNLLGGPLDKNISERKAEALDWKNKEYSGVSSVQGWHARPGNAPAGALYVDVYEESQILLRAHPTGPTPKMTFAVVTKYARNGTPIFVRAQLVSTGTSGHGTPSGEFDIDRRHRYYVSNTYGSRMDFAQFFIGGVALHETPTSNYTLLGRPASHGCVRHHTKDAIAMWVLIDKALNTDRVMVNIKVHRTGERVILADGSPGDARVGFGAKLNDYLEASFACARLDQRSKCTDSWEDYSKSI